VVREQSRQSLSLNEGVPFTLGGCWAGTG